MTQILCVRHAESTDNQAGVCSSLSPGAGLSPLGMMQARNALNRLRVGKPVAVYGSSIKRNLRR